MASMRRAPRLAVGSAAWIAEERSSSLQIAQSEVEEFSFSARNEMEWLNEHMAEIFSENQMNVTELFKTPGRLRGKTPRTARKLKPAEDRVPLADIFSATPKGAPNPFAMPKLSQAQSPRIKVAEDHPRQTQPQSPSPINGPPPASNSDCAAADGAVAASFKDSGYHGSQSQEPIGFDFQVTDILEDGTDSTQDVDFFDFATAQVPGSEHSGPEQASAENTPESAREEERMDHVTASESPSPETRPAAIPEPATEPASPAGGLRPPSPMQKPEAEAAELCPPSPSPAKPPSQPAQQTMSQGPRQGTEDQEDMGADEVRSSDGSSPIRPIVRKSSLNFASLPAREPLTSTKSLGHRTSRISHLDHNRASYYQRHTGGRSLGGNARLDATLDDENDENDDMDMDDDLAAPKEDVAAHNKTYTQRLQDQISMLGKSHSTGPRLSKSLSNVLTAQQPSQPLPSGQPSGQPQSEQPPPPAIEQPATSPSPENKQPNTAPGAFPEDDDNDWISPPTSARQATSSPRLALAKSHSADVMEGVHGRETVGEPDFVLAESGPTSPRESPESPEHTRGAMGHAKSASVPSLPTVPDYGAQDACTKVASVSYPTLNPVSERDVPGTPSKSPSRPIRDSPLKQVKNKLSSILKSSKGLLASSAALSAEGKSSLLSPSSTRLGAHDDRSAETLASAHPLYPDLPQHAATSPNPGPPSENSQRRTRASTEREKREARDKEKEAKAKEKEAKEKEKEAKEKEKEKEMKEAKRVADQMQRLDKAREQEREKARVYTKEQERIAAMEKQMAEQKEQAKRPRPLEAPVAVAAPQSPTRRPPSSPKKPKSKPETETGAAPAAAPETRDVDGDAEMGDGPTHEAANQAPRPASSTAARPPGVKRLAKPTKEAPSKAKQAPTVIRVNTTSAQQSQFHHPSNSALASTLQDTLAAQHHAPQRQPGSKASHAGPPPKQSLQSLKSSVSSTGRPKALELAAKRREQEEREAQRKREAKLEMERKRAVAQEEERRQEQRRRQELERHREEERKQAAAAAAAKKDAQRQAAIERAKQTRAPPPAVRSGPGAPAEHGPDDKGRPRPPSRLGSLMPQDGSRPVSAVLSNAPKAAPKRPLQQEAGEEAGRPPVRRNGPSLQTKESKRIRMSEEFDDDIDMADSQPQIMKGPPVRPSGGLKKELPAKSMFSSGYTPAHQGVSRDLFKATVTAQHSGQAKAAHPLDMAQLSKSAIPFAPNPSGGGPAYKTPARPGGAPGPGKSAMKSAARPSPRFQNGESIELPEIETEDEDEDDGHVGVAAWADSPDLRRALMRQEAVDPLQIFGAPAPLNMEEVFSRSKDRLGKFRARTSSANWSGADRLTEEDIRKDLQARDRMRREGGWTYDLNRDGLA